MTRGHPGGRPLDTVVRCHGTPLAERGGGEAYAASRDCGAGAARHARRAETAGRGGEAYAASRDCGTGRRGIRGEPRLREPNRADCFPQSRHNGWRGRAQNSADAEPKDGKPDASFSSLSFDPVGNLAGARLAPRVYSGDCGHGKHGARIPLHPFVSALDCCPRIQAIADMGLNKDQGCAEIGPIA